MIPLRDQNPTTKTPIVNRLLIVANILVWIYVLTLVRQPSAIVAFYDQYSFDWTEFVTQIAQGHIALATFVPLFSHMFVHGGWLHVIGNMVYLWIFGDNVEERLGSGQYLVFYILCGIVAAIGQGLVQPEPMVGASGAIAVIGFFIVLQAIDALAELRLTAHQATENIAYFAHIFGFVAGILLLLLLRQRREQGRFRFG